LREVRSTVKAKIETIRIMNDGVSLAVQVSFPEFTGPGGDALTHTFETSVQEYTDWHCPNGVTKTPAHFVEYRFIRPTYDKLVTVSGVIANLEGQEFDW